MPKGFLVVAWGGLGSESWRSPSTEGSLWVTAWGLEGWSWGTPEYGGGVSVGYNVGGDWGGGGLSWGGVSAGHSLVGDLGGLVPIAYTCTL